MSNLKIFNQALAYLTRRDHSEPELLHKLLRSSPDQPGEISQVITKLKTLGYLDQQRFLEHRVMHRLNQGYGAHYILAELSQMHGFTREEISAALREHSAAQTDTTGEKSILYKLIKKRIGTLPIQDAVTQNKLIQYCLRRGFQLDEIKKTLSAVVDQNGNASPD